MRKLVLVLMVVVELVFLANSALCFRLSPASLELEVKRGETQTQILSIGNSAEKPIYCRLYTVGLEVLRDGKQLFEEATTEYSAVDWFKPKEPEFEIPANGSKEVEIEITVPRNAKSGEYFATIMAESTAPARGKTPKGVEISIGVNFRLGCITRITVPGWRIRKKAEISEVKAEIPDPAESQKQDIKVIATLQNRCEVHLDAKGEVLIKNTENRVFDKFVLQGAGKNVRGEAFVFPEGARDFWGTVERPLPPGEYVAEVSFDYGYRFRKARAESAFVVSPELGKSQKELLVMDIEPNLLEMKMSAGGFRAKAVRVSNLDFEPLKVEAISQGQWLTAKPERFIIQPGRDQAVRIDVYIPIDESVERTGKILLQPERGKPVTIDIVVSDQRKEGEK